MVSILSFDSRSMSFLLDEKFKDKFDEKYPIFYKNKIQKMNSDNQYYYRNAIENSLRKN